MSDFRRNSSVPDYRNRQLRRRIFVLMGMFFLIVFLMQEARKPKYYRWLWSMTAQPQPVEQEVPIDTRLARRSNTDIPGVIVAAADAPVPVDNARKYFPGVNPEHLGRVRDDTVLRGGSEHDAFFHLLEILNRESEETLEQAATPVTFVQLFKQSDEYRGELVSMHGSLRRAFKLPAAKNDYGIEHYYQTWFWPHDKDFPVVIYFLELPEGFPLGMEIHEEVSAVGFYFKRWAYAAADDIRTAPLILAKRPTWQKEIPWTVRRHDVARGTLIAFGGAILLVLGGIALYTRYARSTALQNLELRQSAGAQQRLSRLTDEEVLPDVHETLARLEQEPDPPAEVEDEYGDEYEDEYYEDEEYSEQEDEEQEGEYEEETTSSPEETDDETTEDASSDDTPSTGPQS